MRILELLWRRTVSKCRGLDNVGICWISIWYQCWLIMIDQPWSTMINHDQPCKSFQSFPQSARAALHSEAQEILLSNPCNVWWTNRSLQRQPAWNRNTSMFVAVQAANSILSATICHAPHTHIIYYIYIYHIYNLWLYILYWFQWLGFVLILNRNCDFDPPDVAVDVKRAFIGGHTQRTRSICWFCFISQCCELKALAIFGTWS